MLFRILLIVTLTFFTVISSNGLCSENEKGKFPFLPEELKNKADEIGCEQIFEYKEYYEKKWIDKPLHAYGYLPGNKDDSAVFWCK